MNYFKTLFLYAVMLAFFAGHSAVNAKERTNTSPLPIQTVTSPQRNITAWLIEDHSVPVISIKFAFDNAGSAQDGLEKQGLARILSNTLDEGAGDLTSQDFQQALNDKSISLYFDSTRDALYGTLKTLSHNSDDAFDLLRKSLSEPRFDDAPVKRMIDANISRILNNQNQADWIAARILNDISFGSHPYALNSGGTLSSLPKISPQDLHDFYNKAIAQDNLHIAVSGDITADQLGIALDSIFGALPQHNDLPAIENTTLQNQGQTFLFEKDIPQTTIHMVQPGISIHSPQYHYAEIMDFILGSSGFGSRLMKTIREDRGLTYGIFTRFINYDHFNGYIVSTSTNNISAAQTLDLIRQEWDHMLTRPITDDEIKTAKTFLIGQMPLALTSTDKIASFLLSLQRQGLPATYLQDRQSIITSATKDNISAVTKDLLLSQNLTTVLVGKPKNISKAITLTKLPNVE